MVFAHKESRIHVTDDVSGDVDLGAVHTYIKAVLDARGVAPPPRSSCARCACKQQVEQSQKIKLRRPGLFTLA